MLHEGACVYIYTDVSVAVVVLIVHNVLIISIFVLSLIVVLL